VLASGAEETAEAAAGAGTVVTDTTARAVTTSLITIAIQRIHATGALLLVASGATVASIAQAADVLHAVPGSGVQATSLGSQVLLGPAAASVIAVVGAHSTLASHTIVTSEALAGASLAVAHTLVGALSPRVQVVLVDNGSNPGEVLGAGSLRAIRASPLGFAVQTQVAVAVVVQLASTVTRAAVLAKSTLAVAALVPGNLSPVLINK